MLDEHILILMSGLVVAGLLVLSYSIGWMNGHLSRIEEEIKPRAGRGVDEGGGTA